MKNQIAILLLLAGLLPAAPLPPAPVISTIEELQKAAAEIPVAKIELILPANESAAETALVKAFFNKPEEHRYSGVTSDNRVAKWDLLAQALINKARGQKLDAKSLEACLLALNRGHNKNTMSIPAFATKLTPPPTATVAEFETENRRYAEADAQYKQALKDREAHPEKWYDEDLAVIPVGVYLARHGGGECWIIVCKWERAPLHATAPLEHIKVWALDTKTASVIHYVTCD